MFRIIGGEFRGKKMTLPDKEITRPTSSRAREALFNILFSLDVHLPSVCFLDGFSGSGAVGMEAISRGARHVIFVESHEKVLSVLHKNLTSLARTSYTLFTKFETVFQASFTPLDVIFLDPPYDLLWKEIPAYTHALYLLRKGIHAKTVVIVETSSATKDLIIEGYEILIQKTYGASRLWFLRQVMTS